MTQETTEKKNRKWTHREDLVLLRKLSHSPGNIHATFMAVAQELGRTTGSVAAHWYSVLSKKPEVFIYGFMTKTFILKNRKNGTKYSLPFQPNIWRRFVALIRSAVH